MRQLHDVTNDVIAHFEQYIKELSAARSRDEGFERSSADLLTRLGKVSDQQLSALNRIRAGQEELAIGHPRREVVDNNVDRFISEV